MLPLLTDYKHRKENNMVKIKCIKDRFGSLIPIDKIEYISKGCWVSVGGSRRDINYNTLVLLLDIFEEIEKEEAPVKGD